MSMGQRRGREQRKQPFFNHPLMNSLRNQTKIKKNVKSSRKINLVRKKKSISTTLRIYKNTLKKF